MSAQYDELKVHEWDEMFKNGQSSIADERQN
jgi:hypothetical protein